MKTSFAKFLALFLGLTLVGTAQAADAPAPAAAPATTTTTSTTSATTETPTTTTETTTTTTTETTAPAPVVGRKGKINVGVLATGYYEYSTNEDLYFDFNADHVSAMGAGFKGLFNYGLTDRLALGGALGFSYLLDANFANSVITRSFWTLDALGNYFFTNYSSFIQPYLAFGAGIIFTSNGLTPVLDLGGGADFKLSDALALRAEILGKSGIVHNRAEVGVGVVIRF